MKIHRTVEIEFNEIDIQNWLKANDMPRIAKLDCLFRILVLDLTRKEQLHIAHRLLENMRKLEKK